MRQTLPGGGYIETDFSGLENLLKKLKQNTYVDVGILGNKGGNRAEGITIAGIGAVHEYGSLDGKIPKRSFIAMPLSVKKSYIQEMAEKSFKRNFSSANMDQIFSDIGIAGETAIQEAFETGGFGMWKPLSPVTIDAKGSDSILIDTGELRKAQTSKVGHS